MKLIISGTTGVGKSTTVNILRKHYESLGKKVIVVGELVVDNPFFELYFEDLTKWGFLAQIDFLMQRFKQWIIFEKELHTKYKKDCIIIYDRHFLEDLIFAELKHVRNSIPNFLTLSHKALHDELLNKIIEFEKPDFFILLKATFDIVAERQFEQRGRSQEEKFNNKYWQDLYYRYYSAKKYRQIFKQYTKDFVEIDTEDSSPEEVVNKITKYISKRTN